MRGLPGKVGIVAGGGRGIGAATAKRLASEGVSVVIGDIMGDWAREIADVITLPREALFKRDWVYTLDVENKVQAKRVSLLHVGETEAWVKGDIAPGEKIVVARQGYLSEGVVVNPQPVNTLVAGG